jgi:hypothetical protein
MRQLRKLVMDTPPGTTVNLDIIRPDEGTEMQSIRVTVTEKQPERLNRERSP